MKGSWPLGNCKVAEAARPRLPSLAASRAALQLKALCVNLSFSASVTSGRLSSANIPDAWTSRTWSASPSKASSPHSRPSVDKQVVLGSVSVCDNLAKISSMSTSPSSSAQRSTAGTICAVYTFSQAVGSFRSRRSNICGGTP